MLAVGIRKKPQKMYSINLLSGGGDITTRCYVNQYENGNVDLLKHMLFETYESKKLKLTSKVLFHRIIH